MRVKDVGRVELSQQQYTIFSGLSGKKTAHIAVFALPGANALQVADEIRSLMAEISKMFPAGLKYTTLYDTTLFINQSVHAVYQTLIEAGILVLIVIMLFLQNFRAMLVPATTVPVTIIGAFAAMALLGFTVNLMTLFALILAIGIVVDDAIVIVENTSRYIEQGLTPKDAAIKAMDELTGSGAGNHLGADGGVFTRVVSAWDHGTDVSAVCVGDSGHGDHQRHQCADVKADPVRVIPATGGQG